jgi:hypothetical protein
VFLISRRACLPLHKTEKAWEVNTKIDLKAVSCHVMKMMGLCQKNILCNVLVSPILVTQQQVLVVRTLRYSVTCEFCNKSREQITDILL